MVTPGNAVKSQKERFKRYHDIFEVPWFPQSLSCWWQWKLQADVNADAIHVGQAILKKMDGCKFGDIKLFKSD